jgi:hypothetical protein
MPRYFFHTDTLSRHTDDEGLDLDGPVEARREAIRACGEMLRDCPEGFWGSRPWSVTVTDVACLILCEVNIDGTASGAAPM